MSTDIMSQFYSSLNWPLEYKLNELTRIIDCSSLNKELQTLFPQLINSIFSSTFTNGRGLKEITYKNNHEDYMLMLNFLGPEGPMFRLCYKLLSDPQLKYNIPLNMLPIGFQINLRKGRYAQFYADMLTMDTQSLNVVALSLNPFDYYIFCFALYLVNNGNPRTSCDVGTCVYFSLVCDYLVHFLPPDPNTVVLPVLLHYSGKVPIVTPLQNTNGPHSPSLLLVSELTGIGNQCASQSRSEVWRSESILQIFIDIFMNNDEFDFQDINMINSHYTSTDSSIERVKIARVLVKHIHSYSAKHLTDSMAHSDFRIYARHLMSSRTYHYVKNLVLTWPLDASFRLVLELWLSLIQPWRYTSTAINRNRFQNTFTSQDEVSARGVLDASYTQIMAEMYPCYTCIFQLMLQRFMRLDLTVFKNAVMLFRMGKVFSQPNLVPILQDLEKSIMDSNPLYQNTAAAVNIYNNNSYTGNRQRWSTVVKQAITEWNSLTNFEYDPIWDSEKKYYSFMKKIMDSKRDAQKNFNAYNTKINSQFQGFWGGIKNWFMIYNQDEQTLLDEYKKIPTYLNECVHYFLNIFGIEENILGPLEPVFEECSQDSSGHDNTNFSFYITNKLRNKPNNIQYKGNPDLMPIKSNENAFLVMVLYQISSKANELFGDEFVRFWRKGDVWGEVARAVLAAPDRGLPPRLSLRPLASHTFLAWLAIGYVLFRLFAYGGLFYMFCVITFWIFFVFSKAAIKVLL